MGKKPKFKVIRSPDMKCCTRTQACTCAHDKTGGRDDTKCPWWLNSKDHGYCFWKYLAEKSSPDGVMKELVQSELAELFGYSNTKTHFVLKQAVDELKVALLANGANELLDGSPEDEEASYPVDLDQEFSAEDPE